MAVLRIFGTCSGTEPMPNRIHTSLAITAGDRNYIFDAGEGCSHAAHLSGMDVLKTRAVFISHTHIDHVGGLAGLFFTLRKLVIRKKGQVADGEVKLYIPDLKVWDTVYELLQLMEGGFSHNFKITVDKPTAGTVFEDENVKVMGFCNNHLKRNEGEECKSFSYRIEVNGKSVVFSGDVGGMDDLVPVVGSGCDLLLCETGHHKVKDVCIFAETHNVGKLLLIHHGREVLYNQPSVQEALDACKIPVILTDDGETFEI